MMLKIPKYLSLLCNQSITRSEHICCTLRWGKEKHFMNLGGDVFGVRCISTGEPRMRKSNREAELRDYGVDDERPTATDGTLSSQRGCLPDINLPEKLFDGIPFKNIPIVNVKATPNNTIINLTDYKGIPKLHRSCGIEGFRHTKKGTNVAAQATALTFSQKALQLGYKTVRLCISGLGPGRMSSIRGLTVGGLNIISVTDTTPISDNPPRPKKPRRI